MQKISAQVSFVFTKESVCAVFGMSIIYSSKLFKSKKRTLFIFTFFFQKPWKHRFWQHKIFPLITWQHNKALLLKSDAHFKKNGRNGACFPPKIKILLTVYWFLLNKASSLSCPHTPWTPPHALYNLGYSDALPRKIYSTVSHTSECVFI